MLSCHRLGQTGMGKEKRITDKHVSNVSRGLTNQVRNMKYGTGSIALSFTLGIIAVGAEVRVSSRQ